MAEQQPPMKTLAYRQPIAPLPSWLKSALKHRGLREIAGSKHNPVIVGWLRDVGLTGAKLADETSWCAAAMNATLVEAGVKGTGRAMARSYLTWGQPLLVPRLGCVAVYSRPPDPESGHVTYWVTDLGDDDLCFGGNQANEMGFALYPRSRSLAYRWPPGALPM